MIICIVISGNYLRYIPLEFLFLYHLMWGTKCWTHHLKVMISNSNNFLRFAHINFFYHLIIFLLLSFQNGSPNISKEVFFKAELLNRRNVFIPINRRLLSLLYSMNNFTAIKCNTMVICCNSDLR